MQNRAHLKFKFMTHCNALASSLLAVQILLSFFEHSQNYFKLNFVYKTGKLRCILQFLGIVDTVSCKSGSSEVRVFVGKCVRLNCAGVLILRLFQWRSFALEIVGREV